MAAARCLIPASFSLAVPSRHIGSSGRRPGAPRPPPASPLQRRASRLGPALALQVVQEGMTQAHFDAMLAQSDKAVLVDFYTTW